MKYSYLVIADEDTVQGFRSVGIPGEAAASADDVLRMVAKARASNVGIIIMTEEVADMARREIDELRFTEELPMLVEVPGPEGPMEGRRSLTDIIREAIGIKV
jgi:V/A-type H+-transporting ATPase subunit F